MPRQLATTPPLTTIRPPSDRDLRIYKHAEIMHVPQYEVAADFELHYTRVSQIIKKVRRWLAAGGDTHDLDLKEHAARQCLSRAHHRLRLQRAIEIAEYQMETNLPTLRTTRRRMQYGTEVWREETSREQTPVNLSAVRLLLRAADALNKLDDDKKPEKTASPPSETDLLRAVFDLLCTWRARAEADGLLPSSKNLRSLIASSLNQLLGPTFSNLHAESQPPSSSSAQDPLNLSAPSTDPIVSTTIPQTPCAAATST